MQIDPMTGSDGAFFRVAGRLDAGQAPAFGERLMSLLAPSDAPAVLDLAGVDYISSGGLRVLLQAAKLVQQRGARLSLTRVPAPVFAILKLSGFTTFMNVHPAE